MNKKIFKKIRHCTLTLLLLLPLLSHAQVVLNRASFEHFEQDRFNLENPLILTRHYSSRSLYRGYFGFGWCSNIEYNMEILSPGEVRLYHCQKRITSF